MSDRLFVTCALPPGLLATWLLSVCRLSGLYAVGSDAE
mgnify:FL=1